MHNFYLRSICRACVLVALSLLADPPPRAAADDTANAKASVGPCLVYVGTYTGGKSRGIYVLRFDPGTGKLSAPTLAAEVKSPSFLAIHPDGKHLFAVSEIDDFAGKKTGGVCSFAIDRASGQLTRLNEQPSGGAGPCHVIVDRKGGTLLVANYGGGSVASLPISADGKLRPAASVIQHKGHSVNPARQEGPHAHSINVDLGNRFAIAADLGLDKLLVYKLDPVSSKLAANEPAAVSLAPGAGPRHFAFHPDGKHAYAINEIACTVTALAYDADRGVLKEIGTVSSLPEGVSVRPEDSTAEVQVHPTGKFVYGSNRGHNSISVFSVGPDGRLKLVQNQSTQGKTPRGFGIDPSGKWLFAGNQDSDTIVLFAIDPQTGNLSPTGKTIEVGAPVCVKFLPLAKLGLEGSGAAGGASR
ncbi:MAG TPA: lactonase family protein [Pirellulales bacterium]|nr:lactonase family protein [Pirellulales bacterium]